MENNATAINTEAKEILIFIPIISTYIVKNWATKMSIENNKITKNFLCNLTTPKLFIRNSILSIT
ncbi:unnamed protein product [marine sediment metagenome]|uniref:Uncharacterized protein n=1 Tax=marine sediment metagenome TaxID=412755 RepID=X0XAA6_9ZZZZ